MAWRNIWRNPRRSILTISAIAFASLLLVFMLSFQFGFYEAAINASVKIHAGHLQIQAEGYQDKKSMRLVVPDPGSMGSILANIEAVKAYTYRANAFSLVSSEKRIHGVMVTGIDPVSEAKVSTLKNLIRDGTYLTDKDDYQALVGQLLAQNLRIGPGDELTLLGQARDGSVAATVVKVQGIYRSGLDELDRSSVHIPLKTFQEVYAMGNAVHQVVAIGESLSAIPEIRASLKSRLSSLNQNNPLKVLDWEELMPGLRQAIEMDLVSGLIFYVLLIIVVGFSILNTFLMAIFERTKEFGIMKAIGTTPVRLTKLLLIESLSITIVGIIAGIILGIGITYYFQIHGIDFSGSSDLLSQFGISGRMYPKITVLSILIGPSLVLGITFLAALYPALKVRRIRPVEALTHV
ncbi:MAG: ABC transporter permease [Deltaproteobacteria bacterium]|nr:MAG: ABC transporter permease [Deltaproteobacteria bacterium]